MVKVSPKQGCPQPAEAAWLPEAAVHKLADARDADERASSMGGGF